MADKLVVTGARGPGLTEIARRTGNFGVQPTDSDTQALTKFADAAIQQNPGFKGETGNTGPANSTYASAATITALAATSNLSAIVADPSQGGTFAYKTGNFTDLIARDTRRAVSTPAQGDPTGANGAWLRIGVQEMNARWFGAKGDGVTDDTAAIAAAIVLARYLGTDVFLPYGNYLVSSSLVMAFIEAQRGITIRGVNSGNYYSEARQTTITYTGQLDYLLKSMGSESGDGSPMFFRFFDLRLIGNNSAPGAVLIHRSWYIEFERCSFINFGNVDGGAITLRANGATGFAGIVTIRDCHFANCGRNVWLTGESGGQINVVRLMNLTSVGHKSFVAGDWGGQIPFTSNIIIRDMLSEGATAEDIINDGVASNWLIDGLYVENANASRSVQFNGAANMGIVVRNSFFRKSALPAGGALVYVINGKDCSVVSNNSGFTGTDRYSVDYVACSNSEAEPFAVAGASPLPTRLNNYVIQSGRVSTTWMTDLPQGTGLFNGVASGDGWPGGTTSTLTARYNKTNARVRVSVKQTITGKASSGDQVLIGLLPFSNDGADEVFRVSITDVSTNKPRFYDAILPTGSPFATVYDSNGDPLSYQTAIKVGTIIRTEFSYVTQQ